MARSARYAEYFNVDILIKEFQPLINMNPDRMLETSRTEGPGILPWRRAA